MRLPTYEQMSQPLLIQGEGGFSAFGTQLLPALGSVLLQLGNPFSQSFRLLVSYF